MKKNGLFLTAIAVMGMLFVGCPSETKGKDTTPTTDGNQFQKIYVGGFNNNWGDGYKMITTDGVNYTVTLTAESDKPTPWGMKFFTDKGWEEQYVRADMFTLTHEDLKYVESNETVKFTKAKKSDVTEGMRTNNSQIYLKYLVEKDTQVTVNFNLETMDVSVVYQHTNVGVNDVLLSDVVPYFDSGAGLIMLSLDNVASSGNTKVYNCQFYYSESIENWEYNTAQVGFLITRAEGEWSQTFYTVNDISVGNETALTFIHYIEPTHGIVGLNNGKYNVKVTIIADDSNVWSHCTVKCLITAAD